MSFRKTVKWVAICVIASPFVVAFAAVFAIVLFYACLMIVDAVQTATPIFGANADLFGWSVLAGVFILVSAYLEDIMRSILAEEFTKMAHQLVMAALVIMVLAVLIRVGIISDTAVSAAGFHWNSSGGMVHIVVQAVYLLATEITFLPFVWRSEMFNPNLVRG